MVVREECLDVQFAFGNPSDSTYKSLPAGLTVGGSQAGTRRHVSLLDWPLWFNALK